MGVKVTSADLELLTSWIVKFSGELDVINLAVQVNLALAKEKTSSHPVDMSMLKECRGL
jgi:DNA replication protein DnaD